jgi:signal transduction histidine kinase
VIVGYALAYSLLITFRHLLVAAGDGEYWRFLALVMGQATIALTIVGISFALANVRSRALRAPAVVAISVVAGTAAGVGLAMLERYYLLPWVVMRGLDGNPTGMRWLLFFRWEVLQWSFAAAAWYAIRSGAQRAERLRLLELDRLALEAGTAESRLRELEAQVEPHFIFNALAHVRWLYRRDRELGRYMLDQLLAYLRSALPHMRASEAPLDDELRLVKAYLEIQQVRIGRRLAYEIEVTERARRVRVPTMMLMSLVENAIKHGVGPLPDGATIRIAAGVANGLLRVEVTDTGAGLATQAGSGIGLSNIHSRLHALFGSRARLIVEPNTPHGLHAALEIPC